MTVTAPTLLQGLWEVLPAPPGKGDPFPLWLGFFGDFDPGELHCCTWFPQNRRAGKEQGGTDFCRSISHLEGQEMVKPSGHFLAVFPCS